jgi:hypothetical protein
MRDMPAMFLGPTAWGTFEGGGPRPNPPFGGEAPLISPGGLPANGGALFEMGVGP